MKTMVFKNLGNSSKKKLFLIPFLFTFANALCGFFSVIQSLDDEFTIAAFCIIAAACMDLCDGRLARIFNSVSVLGMELDSLCDAISFCFAPAILLYSWSLYQIGFAGVLVLGLYLCCGLFRLARFNVNHASQASSFNGMPTTLAAFLFANIIIYEQWIAASRFHSVLKPDRLAFFVCIIALLMVSSIRFPSAKAIKMRFATASILIIAIVISLWALSKGFPLFLLVTVVYIIVCFMIGIFKEISRLFTSAKNSRL